MTRRALPLLLLAGGCAAPGPKDVWVDLRRVRVPPTIVGGEPVLSTPGLPARTLTLPGLPARVLPDPPGLSPARLRADARAQADRSRVRLEKRLRAFYETEARRFRIDDELRLGRESAVRLSAAEARFRLLFERYADARAPILARLAVLVGFPDPGQRPDTGLTISPVREERRAQARALREEIARLDADFAALVADLVRERTVDDAAARADALIALERFRDRLQRRAAEEAARLTRVELSELPTSVLGTGVRTLPAVPARTAQVPAVPGATGPRVPSPDAATTAARERARAEGDLRIFLAWRGYRLHRGATDRTDEFLQWRKDPTQASSSASSPSGSAAR